MRFSSDPQKPDSGVRFFGTMVGVRSQILTPFLKTPLISRDMCALSRVPDLPGGSLEQLLRSQTAFAFIVYGFSVPGAQQLPSNGSASIRVHRC